MPEGVELNTPTLESILTCPQCGFAKRETMPHNGAAACALLDTRLVTLLPCIKLNARTSIRAS